MALLHVMQFYAGNVTTVCPTRTTCYTVPAGDRIVIRDWAVRNVAAPPTTQQVQYWVAGQIVRTINLGSGGGVSGSDEWKSWIVATPGQKIEVCTQLAAGVSIVISGSLYTI